MRSPLRPAIIDVWKTLLKAPNDNEFKTQLESFLLNFRTEEQMHRQRVSILELICQRGYLLSFTLFAKFRGVNDLLKTASFPLIIAVGNNDSIFVESLLAHGVDVNHECANTTSPLNLAYSLGFMEIAMTLTNNGARTTTTRENILDTECEPVTQMPQRVDERMTAKRRNELNELNTLRELTAKQRELIAKQQEELFELDTLGELAAKQGELIVKQREELESMRMERDGQYEELKNKRTADIINIIGMLVDVNAKKTVREVLDCLYDKLDDELNKN